MMLVSAQVLSAALALVPLVGKSDEACALLSAVGCGRVQPPHLGPCLTSRAAVTLAVPGLFLELMPEKTGAHRCHWPESPQVRGAEPRAASTHSPRSTCEATRREPVCFPSMALVSPGSGAPPAGECAGGWLCQGQQPPPRRSRGLTSTPFLVSLATSMPVASSAPLGREFPLNDAVSGSFQGDTCFHPSRRLP